MAEQSRSNDRWSGEVRASVVYCIERWEGCADGYHRRTYTFNSRDELNRAEAWLRLKGADAPLPPPDTFQLAPDVGVASAVGNDGGTLTVANGGTINFGGNSLPNPAPWIVETDFHRSEPLPRSPSFEDIAKVWIDLCKQYVNRNVYCVANHTGMEDCCPDCGRDPEARKTMMIHNGAETEGCYVTCPKGCQSTGPFHRPELAWGQWHAKCRERV